MTMTMQQCHNTAVNCFRHWHKSYDSSPDTRMNCGACALLGYEPRGGWGDGYSVRRDGPYYSGWAKVYVEARRAIPKKWEAAFECERHSDNELYAAALDEAIEHFGVRFV